MIPCFIIKLYRDVKVYVVNITNLFVFFYAPRINGKYLGPPNLIAHIMSNNMELIMFLKKVIIF